MVAIDKQQRVPPEVNGIQYNFCKNPKCSNFGIPTPEESKKGIPGPYVINGVGTTRSIKCNACGEFFIMKSNQAIYEEFLRLTDYLKPQVTCPDRDCKNHTIPVGTPKAYASYGKQKSGAKRYRCNACKNIFTNSLPTYRQEHTSQNVEIFKLLVNSMPLNRIIEVTGVSWELLYHRINFIHKQCLAFANQQESTLKNKNINRLYLSSDHQDYVVNWTERGDKRNITLNAIATADNTSGYVFGINLNFDKDTDRNAVQTESDILNDSFLAPAYRKFARLWLRDDYKNSVENNIKANIKKKQRNAGVEPTELKDIITEKYNETTDKEDTEATEKSSDEKLPDYGVQVKTEYTMFAHFLLLKSLFGNVGKWRFSLDQDSGIRGAFMNAFKDEVKNKTADAFYVAIQKEISVDTKRHLKNDAERMIATYIKENPQFDREQAKLELLKQSIVATTPIGKWKDKWVNHPIPTMSEPLKKMCWLTEDETMSLDHKAWLYNKCSLHGVDSFFQKVRRRVSMLERPIRSASSGYRVYNGYGAYNPAMVVKLLDIYRIVHNYIDTKELRIETGELTKAGKKKHRIEYYTPAMELGLAGKPMTYEEVLCFNI